MMVRVVPLLKKLSYRTAFTRQSSLREDCPSETSKQFELVIR